MDPTRSRSRWAPRVAAGAAVTVAATALAVGVVGRPPTAAAVVSLEPFDDCSALAQWSRDLLRPMVGAGGLTGGPAVLARTGQEAMAAAGDSGQAAAGGAPVAEADASTAVGVGGTGTNLQEAGVDEPDIVKTDGRLLVTTVGDELVLLDVTGGTPRRLGSVALPAMGWTAGGFGGDVPVDVLPSEEPTSGTSSDTATSSVEPFPGTGPALPLPATAGGAELLLVGDRVVVLGTSWYSPAPVPAPDGPDGPGGGPDRPGLTRGGAEPDVDAGMLVGIPPVTVSTTTATVVDISDPAAPQVVSSTEVEGGYVSARESEGTVRLVVSSSPVLPFTTSTSSEYGPDGMPVDPAALEGNLDVLEQAPGEAFLPHVVVRSADGAVERRRPAMACSAVSHPAEPSGSGTVTVATLDVAGVAAGGDPVVDAVGVSADGDLVYSSPERLYVATTVGGWASAGGDSAPDQIRTQLHGFDVTDAQRTAYVTSGDVAGHLLGRWALSARDGNLRVATTRGDFFGGGSIDSAVTVLAEQEGGLVAVGEVSGLGAGEQIRAVRWFEDSAVVVTFRQTDPLYVVDLADPTAPTLTGELKIPGYSAYLHPVGDSRLLGVGQDATETGMTTGVQVSSFDLTDPAAPTRVDALTEPDTYTAVESDSRLFTYLPERRVALLPVDGASGTSLRAVRVNEAGALAEVGAYYPGSSEPAEAEGTSYSSLQRAVAVDGDRVAVLVQDQAGPSLTMLTLDELTAVDEPLRLG